MTHFYCPHTTFMKKRTALFTFLAAIVLFLPFAIYAADPATATESKPCGATSEIYTGGFTGKIVSEEAQGQTPWRLEVPFGEIICVTLPQYINYLHQYLVGAAGILAVVMIMFGGYRWLFSQGNQQKISEAQDMIVTSVIGLVLALTSYLLLYTLNPATTTLNELQLPSLQKRNIAALGVDSPCTWDQAFNNPNQLQVIECGGAIQLPDVPGKEPSYCMSRWCKSDNNVCILTKDPNTKKYVGGGCSSAFYASYGGQTYPVDVNDETFWQELNCGEGDKDEEKSIWYMGSRCIDTWWGDGKPVNGVRRRFTCVIETDDGIPEFNNFPTEEGWFTKDNMFQTQCYNHES